MDISGVPPELADNGMRMTHGKTTLYQPFHAFCSLDLFNDFAAMRHRTGNPYEQQFGYSRAVRRVLYARNRVLLP
jgi:hypothetical protein